MVIKTTELVYLNEAAKALKQKDFQIVENVIIGVDMIESCIKYTTLDFNIFYNLDLSGYIINSRELSAFIKTISTESEFIFENDPYCFNALSIHSNMGGILLFKNASSNINNMLNNTIYRLSSAKEINNRIPLCDEVCINDKISQLFSLRTDDGCISYIHENKYFMTLFAGILPVRKKDSVYLTIYPSDSNTFIAKFRIAKKKFNVFVYIRYLYI